MEDSERGEKRKKRINEGIEIEKWDGYFRELLRAVE